MIDDTSIRALFFVREGENGSTIWEMEIDKVNRLIFLGTGDSLNGESTD